MTVSKSRFLQQLRKGMFPAIDDPRQEFKRKLQKQLHNNLGVASGLRTSKPKTSRTGRGGAGVRVGRPSRP